MSVSEAASGNTGRQDRSLSYRDRALGLTVGALLLWLGAAAVVVADAAVHDRIPDAVSILLCGVAGTATIGAMVWWTRAVSSESLGRLAAEVKQISAKIETADTAFDYGRRYQDTVNGPGRGHGLRSIPGEN